MAEDLSVLRNAQLINDMTGIRTQGVYLAIHAVMAIFLVNQRYVLTTSWFWKQAFDCPVRPVNFQKLVETVAGFVPASPKEIVAAAEEVCDALLNLVRERGISIESEELQV